MKKILKYTLVALLVILIAMQFYRPDHSVPEFDVKDDFFNHVESSQEVKTLVRAACYDCHSYETQYPWYDKVAPISYWLADHVKHGRKHLNFSIWGTYPAKRSDHKLEECVEMVGETKMPLLSYTIAHSEARMSKEQRKMLVDYFDQLRK